MLTGPARSLRCKSIPTANSPFRESTGIANVDPLPGGGCLHTLFGYGCFLFSPSFSLLWSPTATSRPVFWPTCSLSLSPSLDISGLYSRPRATTSKNGSAASVFLPPYRLIGGGTSFSCFLRPASLSLLSRAHLAAPSSPFSRLPPLLPRLYFSYHPTNHPPLIIINISHKHRLSSQMTILVLAPASNG